ncbi:acyl-CoA dehydratase activase [Candidatus Saccharibacteria bacterium]|nr:acyl-CoA dehydratase activase [Candidatus Saccharibacteria bacterium]
MNSCRVGLDIGSTTIKIVVLDAADQILHKRYERHGADVGATLHRLITEAEQLFDGIEITVSMTGSGALSLSEALSINFIQEVNASELAIRRFSPETDTVIELGGEDAKAIFIYPDKVGYEMNDTCAGGTGAFIDQMASLLDTDADGLDALAKLATKTHGIASRCGVFAKSDIQPMINSSVPQSEIAASIFLAVANQVIGNLMKGKKDRCHHVTLLGGPLAFTSELRHAFRKRLPDAEVVCPENAEFYIALGAALASEKAPSTSLHKILESIEKAPALKVGLPRLKRLFADESERANFRRNHKTKIVHAQVANQEPLFLGIDAGSTTFKAALINEDRQIVWSHYDSNRGNINERIERTKRQLTGYNIVHSVAVGYGEDRIIKSGLANSGEVETVAHLTAAKFLNPKVDFILDIGGQDMKGIWVKDGVVSKVQLNEACSSGCGSFIETYAKPLGLTMDQFDDLACSSTSPVGLGTRCTVFMNSGIKQAQKEGIPLSDIAAGLSYSVVHNALYKVFRVNSAEDLGRNIVVQGGTFLNDSILRAFELEVGATVIRPEIAGLMGAFGAALLAHKRAHNPKLIPKIVSHTEELPNLYETKLNLLVNRHSEDYWPSHDEPLAPHNIIGIPLALNMFENYPFWHAFFSSLGYRVIPSQISDKTTYQKGIDTIFSGMVCYPAKLLHGHIIDLIDRGVKRIWMPLIKWELAEKDQKKHFNCPVVMGYPHAVKQNMPIIKASGATMFTDPLPYDKPRALLKHLIALPFVADHDRWRINRAFKNAQAADRQFKQAMHNAGKTALKYLAEHDVRGIVLAGHPYHIDPEVNHDIPKMLNSLGVAVLTEDSIAHLTENGQLRVSNQWVYHARLYRSARFVAQHANLDLIQLVSFGCGLDAVTSDQVQEILEAAGKIYTQLKIDEMSDSRPARIRARTLLFALRELNAL